MKITIIGIGYVGLVTGACLSDLGHDVVGVDVDQGKIDGLKKGVMPIYEPSLKEVVDRNIKEGRLVFTTSFEKGISESNVIFIAVNTPQDTDGSADLKYVLKVAEDIGKNIKEYKVIVTKSTVPVGTAEKVNKEILKQNPDAKFDMVSNPEFLREGAAIKDFMNPDRIIIGVDNDKAKEVMKEIYYGIERAGRPVVFTDIKSSEIIKYASNAMLATRISFVNMLSALCEKQGGNILSVAKGMGLDGRIGSRFLHAGIGYGGSCFPKDVNALIKTLDENGCSAGILKEVNATNKRQRERFVENVCSKLDVNGKTIAIWGLAFKPKTDDIRDAPSIDVIKTLQEKGAKIKAFDPEAVENAKEELSDVEFVGKPYDAVEGSDALLILTEWDEFRSIDLEKVKSLLKDPIIFDGRNIYDNEIMKKYGFTYYSIGRVGLTNKVD